MLTNNIIGQTSSKSLCQHSPHASNGFCTTWPAVDFKHNMPIRKPIRMQAADYMRTAKHRAIENHCSDAYCIAALCLSFTLLGISHLCATATLAF